MSTQSPTGHEIAAVRQLGRLLDASPAYHALGGEARRDLDHALDRIQRYLSPDDPPMARQMAPDLRSRLAPGGDSGLTPVAPLTPSPTPNSLTGTAPAPATPAPSQGPVGRVGEVARATLNAINFPEFVASLIQGTFQAIVDASIQQMEAYAELLKNVAGTVDRFMQDNITDGMAKDYLTDQYSGVFGRDTSGGAARLVVNQDSGGELPSFFKDMGFDSPAQINDQSLNDVVVPSTKRMLAERRQQTLATMVLMGMNRVIVKDGEISAKLMFHIDATETTQLKFDQNKVSSGNMSGTAGRNPFGATSVMVNTTSLNAQSALNVRADLTGQVTVRFASETFPLERFADSAAIQLINNNAKVPQAAAPAAAPAPATPGAPAAAPGLPPPPLPALPAAPAPAPAPPRAVASQGLAVDDPWAPSGRTS